MCRRLADVTAAMLGEHLELGLSPFIRMSSTSPKEEYELSDRSLETFKSVFQRSARMNAAVRLMTVWRRDNRPRDAICVARCQLSSRRQPMQQRPDLAQEVFASTCETQLLRKFNPIPIDGVRDTKTAEDW